MGKILIVETNVDKYEKHDIKTGLWFGEMTHFYEDVTAAGYEVDFVSPKGGAVPLDPNSLKRLKDTDKEFLNNKEFVGRALENTLRPDQVNPEDYDAIYYTGGHGVLWDFPENEELAKIAAEIYKDGGFVTGVCHGVVGLLNIKDESGKFLIDGKKVTGFTNTEEVLSGKSRKVPFSTEDALKDRGGKYEKRRFFSSFAVSDERVITGQNPWSPKAVAELLIKEMGEKNGK